MSWKKNGCSYMLWFIYSAAAACLCVCVGVRLCTGAGYEAAAGLFFAGAALVISGLAVLLLHKLTNFVGRKSTKKKNEAVAPILESLGAIILFAAGIWLRVQETSGMQVQSAYFDAAKVVEGQTIPMVVHGATYVYLTLLHLVCLLFGNKIAAAVVLQVILQLMAFIFLYFAVRRLAGAVPALVMLAFAMLSPGLIRESGELSPGMLFLFFFAAVMAFGAWLSSKGRPWAFGLAGVLGGAVCYLDVSGILLLVYILGLAFLKPDQEPAEKRKVRFGSSFQIWSLGGFLAGFFVLIAADALFCGKNVGNILEAWMALYSPGEFELPQALSAEGISGEVILLSCCLLPGIYSFWCRKKKERFRIWIFMVILSGGLQCLQMTAEELDGSTLLYILLSVLAGVGIREIFSEPVKAPDHMEQTPFKQAEEEEFTILREFDKDRKTQDMQEEKAENKERKEEEKAQKQQINYIENPLPLPKKHEKKVMDYKISCAVQDDFDFPVEDNDDFDL